MTLYEESSRVLSHAIRNGVIDTDLSLISNPFLVSMLNWMPKRETEYEQNPNTFAPFENSKSLRWQEQENFPAATHTTVTDYFAVELARFKVPKGQTGFIRYIDQVLNDINGSYYPTNNEYWGSPTFVLPDIDNCRWYLRLDYYDGIDPARFTLSSPAVFTAQLLPGLPYPDLSEISALWYPANNCRDLKLIVPGNRMLRLFFWTPPTTVYQWQVAGKLSGWTQSTFSLAAKMNSRLVK